MLPARKDWNIWKYLGYFLQPNFLLSKVRQFEGGMVCTILKFYSNHLGASIGNILSKMRIIWKTQIIPSTRTMPAGKGLESSKILTLKKNKYLRHSSLDSLSQVSNEKSPPPPPPYLNSSHKKVSSKRKQALKALMMDTTHFISTYLENLNNIKSSFIKALPMTQFQYMLMLKSKAKF